jgi:hypothetical protein
VGCPIRKSSDQRVFAPPRRLSQRITSFIACACQGIHQLPLRHLIILIANAHPGQNPRRYWRKKTSFSRSERWPRSGWPIRCRGLSVPLRQTIPQKEDGVRSNLLFTMSKQNRRNARQSAPANFSHANDCRAKTSVQAKRSPQKHWWSRTGSNRRPPACKAGALPAELRPRRAEGAKMSDDRHQRTDFLSSVLRHPSSESGGPGRT